jgi:hypothetical protein
MMDLYSGYDQRALHEESHDLTTFGTPLGPHRLTMLPQGHANAVQVYQGDTAFILQDEIPDYTSPFIDDVPVKSVKTRYQRTDGSYETIAPNEEYELVVTSSTRYFILDQKLWRRNSQGKHQLVVPESRRYRILKEAHNDLGHKGVYLIHARLLLRFWWPMIIKDIKWYNKTCHECQIQQSRKLHIPPTVPIPGGIFRRAHIDSMMMPKAGGFDRLVHV